MCKAFFLNKVKTCNMRKVLYLLLLIIIFNSTLEAQKKTYMRFYTVAGKKFESGFYGGSTDSSIAVYKNKEKIEIAVSKIGVIRTRRSLGHSMLVGAAIGGVPLGLIGVASGEEPQPGSYYTFTSGQQLKLGLFLGGIFGAAIGSLIHGFQKRTAFIINGSSVRWIEQRNAVEKAELLKGLNDYKIE
jgi:hypothetical protein